MDIILAPLYTMFPLTTEVDLCSLVEKLVQHDSGNQLFGPLLSQTNLAHFHLAAGGVNLGWLIADTTVTANPGQQVGAIANWVVEQLQIGGCTHTCVSQALLAANDPGWSWLGRRELVTLIGTALHMGEDPIGLYRSIAASLDFSVIPADDWANALEDTLERVTAEAVSADNAHCVTA